MSFINGKWIDIPDKVVSLNQESIQLEPADSLFHESMTAVQPDILSIPNITLPQSIRVVLVGTICENGLPTNKKIGNYIDIDVYP